MKNPFKRGPSEVDRQLATIRGLSEQMAAMADDIRRETSVPALRAKLAELDPRLLDLLVDQSRFESLIGGESTALSQRTSAVKNCRWAFREDVQIGSATETWTDWGFGRRLAISAVDEAADAVWQECWKAPRNRALFRQSKIHTLSEKILTDGETFFIAYASEQDGTTTWRTLDTFAIQSIIHPSTDDSVNVWYIATIGSKTFAIPDAFTYFAMKNFVDTTPIPAGAENINETEESRANGGTFAVIVPAMRKVDYGRGWPEFRKALPWSQVYSQMLREYSAVFSAVAMYVDKLKAKGGSRTVNDIITALQSSLATVAGSYDDTNPTPAAGSTWVENEAIDRTRLPLGSAAGDAQTGTMTVGTQLATALGVKLSDIGRSDAFQNKATADIAAESPQQRWQRYQVFWTDTWQDIVETTLRLFALWHKGTVFTSYEAQVSTSLPMDIETTTVVAAMGAVDKSAAAMTLDMGVAQRANTALLELMLLDLGVDDIESVLESPPAPTAEVSPASFGESHAPVTVSHVCPLCGASSAHCYEGHGGLLVCVECGKTYDPEVE